jgi:hypothetical protein
MPTSDRLELAYECVKESNRILERGFGHLYHLTRGQVKGLKEAQLGVLDAIRAVSLAKMEIKNASDLCFDWPEPEFEAPRASDPIAIAIQSRITNLENRLGKIGG